LMTTSKKVGKQTILAETRSSHQTLKKMGGEKGNSTRKNLKKGPLRGDREEGGKALVRAA